MKNMDYWVITSTEEAHGPFDCESDATLYATTNLVDERWTVTTTS